MLCFISGLIVSPKKMLILSQAQRDKKEALVLSALNLKSLEALNLRETFQQIYHAPTQEQFEYLLNKWHSWATVSE